MEHNFKQLLIAYIASLIVSLLAIAVCRKWPNTGRLLFMLLFTWAGFFNISTAIATPQVYLDYGQFTFLPFYRHFIYGFFAQHVSVIVSIIGIMQLLIGISLFLNRNFVKAGLIGAIIFLVAIAPLGIGSAFPSTLLMAYACYQLFKRSHPHNLFLTFTKWLQRHRPARQHTR